MAPAQRGLGVMIKRGGNRRTARLNAPGVYINIEHVSSCEPRQLPSEVPMCKSAGLVEAPRGSPWLEALSRSDCKRLMILLQENPCYVVQTGEAGQTVLHAAVERGCLKLLDQIFDLFDDNEHFVDEKEEIQLPLKELLKAKCTWGERVEVVGAVGLTAFELSWWVMGHCDARRSFYMGRGYGRRRLVSYQSEIFNSSITDDPEAVEEGSSSARTLLLEVLADHRSLLCDRMRSQFDSHVSYEFVADFEEFRFHQACTEVHKDEFRKYVEAVIGGCAEKGPHVLRYLFQLRNAQGKTPLHAAVCHVSDLVDLIPGRKSGENAECLNMRNCRGWTIWHTIAGTYFSGVENAKALLADGRADVNAKLRPSNYCISSGATALHVAVLNNNPEVVEVLLQHPSTDVNARFHRRI